MVLLLTKTGSFQSAPHARTFASLDIPVGSKGAESDPDVSEELSQKFLSHNDGYHKIGQVGMWGFMVDVKVTV